MHNSDTYLFAYWLSDVSNIARVNTARNDVILGYATLVHVLMVDIKAQD